MESKNLTKFDSIQKLQGIEKWTPNDVADYFESEGLSDYRELLTHHKISGIVAPQLTDADLKDVGIDIVGDRCRFRHVIKSMSRRARAIQRNKVIWEGKERLWFDKCEGCVNTCGGFCPEDPSLYKLTNNHLKIKTVEPCRVGPVRMCCCNKYNHNNVDLSQVKDVDMNGVPAPFCQKCFCCADGKEVIDIEIENQATVFLTVGENEGEGIMNMILNQIEESQMIERD